MSKSFVLNKQTTPGVCDARRCESASTEFYENGSKLCKRHATMVVDDEEWRNLKDNPHTAPVTGEHMAKDAVMRTVEPIQQEAEEQVGQLSELEILDEEMAAMAAEFLVDVHERLKKLKTEKESVTKPINASLKQIRSWFKPAETSLEQAKKLLKEKINEFRLKQEEIRRVALSSGDTKLAMATKAPEVPEGMRESKKWTYDVIDIHLIPRHYMEVDHAAISQLMKDKDPETLEVPGIKFYQTRDLVMKGKRS